MVILGLVGKWSGHFGTIDIDNALEFFYAASFLYFGRNWRTGAIQDSSEPSKADKQDAASSK